MRRLPKGAGATPDGVEEGAITPFDGAEASGGRRVFAFDLRAAAGTVRVVAIDNAAGRLAGGPDGPQAQWLREVMDGARTRGIPVVVVGSASLDGAQLMPRADDAEEELALLVGNASAYVATAGVDDPADPHFGGVLSRTEISRPNAAATLAVFQSSTLGYSPARSPWQIEDDYDEAEFNRQTSAALLMLDVAVGRYDAAHGRGAGDGDVGAARGDARARQLAADHPGRLRAAARRRRRRSRAAAVPVARGQTSEPLEQGSAFNGVFLPQHQCALWSLSCDSVVPTDIAFTSSNPQVARFVAVRRGRTSGDQVRPEIVLDAEGRVVDDPRGVFCPLAPGTTEVTVTTAGRRVSSTIEVVPTSALRLPREVRVTPIAPGTCGFPDFAARERPAGSARRGARDARAGAATHSGADRPATGTRPQSRAGTAAAAADRPAGAATAARSHPWSPRRS